MNIGKWLLECECGECADCTIERYRKALEEIAAGYHCSACSCTCDKVANKALRSVNGAS